MLEEKLWTPKSPKKSLFKLDLMEDLWLEESLLIFYYTSLPPHQSGSTNRWRNCGSLPLVLGQSIYTLAQDLYRK